MFKEFFKKIKKILRKKEGLAARKVTVTSKANPLSSRKSIKKKATSKKA